MERQAIDVDQEPPVGKCEIGHCNHMAVLIRDSNPPFEVSDGVFRLVWTSTAVRANSCGLVEVCQTQSSQEHREPQGPVGS